MADTEVRFTANLTAVERRALENVAHIENSSLNFVARMAIREYVGQEQLRKASRQLLAEVEAENGNTGNG